MDTLSLTFFINYGLYDYDYSDFSTVNPNNSAAFLYLFNESLLIPIIHHLLKIIAFLFLTIIIRVYSPNSFYPNCSIL